ncbi:MAG: transketolase family protein [Candidatus Daviesbacteria bacterium]|nr:transketolase family protein [Candidatus Daviesbacteria bacterium]
MDKVSMRDGFAEGLVQAGEEDENLIVVCADLVKSIKIDKFAEIFPDRVIDLGVAEQNLVTVSSGIASCGKNVFAASYAIFSPGRNWEQIRTTICINNQPVKIVGSHAGITTGPDGATHQALEDIALMRVLPNMIVLSPCDYLETKKATIAMAKLNKPCYIRFPRSEVPIITTLDSPFEIGKAQVLKEGNDVSIIATGEMVHFAQLAASELETSNISARVINVSTIKPLDTKVIQQAAEDTGAIVTVEDHQIVGGLGSAIAEYLSENFPVPIKMVGIKDKFGESGAPEELMQKYGLTKEEIIKAVTTVLRMSAKG